MWHYNEDGRNVCVMNDYSINGHLISNSFVHISSEKKVNDTLVIPCTCQNLQFHAKCRNWSGIQNFPRRVLHALYIFQWPFAECYELINQGHANIPWPLQIVFNGVYEWPSTAIRWHTRYRNYKALGKRKSLLSTCHNKLCRRDLLHTVPFCFLCCSQHQQKKNASISKTV